MIDRFDLANSLDFNRATQPNRFLVEEIWNCLALGIRGHAGD